VAEGVQLSHTAAVHVRPQRGALRRGDAANNHATDYGPAGLLDTLGALDAAHVRHIGAGVDAVSARAGDRETKRLRVAFPGYVATPDEGGGFSIGAWAAGPATPGLALGTRTRSRRTSRRRDRRRFRDRRRARRRRVPHGAERHAQRAGAGRA
jgi:poly-gamma-glutamate capsule biosynthesis protein CapA/YwtB (metallophosphatase superfamily)